MDIFTLSLLFFVLAILAVLSGLFLMDTIDDYIAKKKGKGKK